MAGVSVGLAIKWARETSGMTQSELASRMKVHRTWLFRIEKGDREVSFSDAEAVASAVNMTIDRMRLGNLPDVLVKMRSSHKRQFGAVLRRFGAGVVDAAIDGLRMPSEDFICSVCKSLKLSPESLLYGVPELCIA